MVHQQNGIFKPPKNQDHQSIPLTSLIPTMPSKSPQLLPFTRYTSPNSHPKFPNTHLSCPLSWL